VAFKDAGLFVLASKRGTPEEVFALIRAGPFGYLSIAAHAHADALAFTLSVGGKPFLVDPGTFTYYADPRRHSWFRSTAAHNTVTVDGQSQAVEGGPFLWTRHASAHVQSWEPFADGARLEAWHDGYARLPGKVRHRRRCELHGHALTIEDRIEGRGTHALAWRFHFAPECRVSLSGSTCRAERSGAAIEMLLDTGIDWRLESDGWYSPCMNVKVQSVVLAGSLNAALPVTKTVRIGIAL
jgi:uncharacterized heparinase superfamily protein